VFHAVGPENENEPRTSLEMKSILDEVHIVLDNAGNVDILVIAVLYMNY